MRILLLALLTFMPTLGQAALLGEQLPVQKRLDRLFNRPGITETKTSLHAAGFYDFQEGYSGIICAKHPALSGYVIKIYLQTGPFIDTWSRFEGRISGAEAVRTAIESHGVGHLFKVPKKWTYPLLHEGGRAVLIAEDMELISNHENLRKWRASVDEELLLALFTLIEELGLSDSVYPFNLPFSRDGKIAFVDTEHHHEWPVPYKKLLHYLSPRMQAYWRFLAK